MAENTQSIILKAIVQLFRPVAGFCMRRGLKIQEATEALKRSFIEAASQDLKLHGESINISRLAVMTGLHRRDVMRLTNPNEGEIEGDNLLTRIIGQWRSDKKFCTKRGEPRVLSVEGGDSEFVQLVTSVSKDLNAFTILFELERLGAVSRDAGKVALVADVYVPRGNLRESLRLFTEDVENLIRGVEENIFQQPKVPHLHIKTAYDNICLKHLPQIREWFLQAGTKFHNDARKYLSQFDKDLSTNLKSLDGGGKVVVGTFSFCEPPQDRGIDKEKDNVA